jgi:6-phosphogluconolactonase
MKNFESVQLADDVEVAETAAREWADDIATLQVSGKPICVAVSGGRIAQTFFSKLTGQFRARDLKKDLVHFFWADERCVPPSDKESNFAIAREHLFEPLNIPEAQIHRVRGEEPPDRAAAETEAELRGVAHRTDAGQPVLDLVFLGIGEDGHTASLFPGEPAEAISNPAVYRAVISPSKPPPQRVTIGYPALGAARRIWVLAPGKAKESALRHSISADAVTPLGRVIRLRKNTRILTDTSLE